MNPLQNLLAAAFREAAAAIDPVRVRGAASTPQRIEAWVTGEAVRGQTRWIEAAGRAAEDGANRASASASAWLHAWCKAWGSRAVPGFRQEADRLAPTLPSEPSSVPAWLAYWRSTGRAEWLNRALAALPSEPSPGDLELAEALRQAWRATASDDLAKAAGRSYGDLSQVPLIGLPGACELLGREGLDPDHLETLLETAAPEETIISTAALGLPLLELEIQWWIERELREGPVAEAITYPWPALEVRFSKLDQRDQVRFVPRLDGVEFPVIDDAGVVGAGLSGLLSEADRGPFLEAAGTRHRRKLRR